MTVINLGSLGTRGVKLVGTSPHMVLGWSLSAAGDVNGDGVDDIIVGFFRTNSGNGPGGAFVIYGDVGGLGTLDLASLAPSDGFFALAPAGSNLAGETVSGAGDIDGDGFDDVLIGNPRHNNYAGRTFVVRGAETRSGPVDLGAMTAQTGFAITSNQSSIWSGLYLSSLGDINQDGYDDFIIGGYPATEAWVVMGRATGFGNLSLSPLDPANGFIIQRGPNQIVGSAFAGLGDFNGDDIDDFAIGLGAGNKVHIVFGNSSGFGAINLASFTAADGFVMTGPNFGEGVGVNLSSAGDVNGDGLQDVIIRNYAGKVYVVFGRPGGAATIDLANLGTGGFIIQALQDSDVSGAGDVNGDGFDDLLIGALSDNRGGTYAGGAYIVYGKVNLSGTLSLNSSLADSDGFFMQGEAGNFGGHFVSSAGDVNGDGFADVLVSGTGDDTGGTSAGAVYLVYGLEPTVDVTRIGSIGGQTIRGGTGNDLIDGQGGDDSLFGGAGNDQLIGGVGADHMSGGAGDDTYTVNDPGDVVSELAGEGTDIVYSSVSFVLGDNVENLILTGSDAIDGTGNGLANSLTGNGADNVLDGGAGADSMTGGPGDDVYHLDNAGDTVTELSGEGTDEIRTSLAVFSLVGLPNIENLAATSSVNHDFRGNGGDNVITGAGGNDSLRLQDGGIDSASGGGGNDFFLFGGSLTSDDSVDGGAGTDQVAIQGNYTLTLGAGFRNVESLIPLPSNDVRFGGSGTNFYDYDLTAVDENLSAGQRLTVDANRLRVGEEFTFDGTAETDGNFFLVGGSGVDTLTGGLQNDTFLFGENGQWGAADTVNGGPGGSNDQLALRGNYTIVFGAGQLTGIESIALVSAQDTRFGPLGSVYNYDLTMHDDNVGAGGLFTIDGGNLRSGEVLTVNAAAETNGSYRVAGGAGADTITGGAQGDILIGRIGADTLRGNGGNDLFRIDAIAESNASGRDTILDFASGDRIDLSRIDAIAGTQGNDAFTFIGNAAFGNQAGQLRFESTGGNSWLVQGDTDGNGIADFEVAVTIDDLHPITAADFIL